MGAPVAPIHGTEPIDGVRQSRVYQLGRMPVLRVRGFGLPEGEPIGLYADGNRWTTDPVPGAELVAEGWVLPGLVNAHTHPGESLPGLRRPGGRPPDAVVYAAAPRPRLEELDHPLAVVLRGRLPPPAEPEKSAERGRLA